MGTTSIRCSVPLIIFEKTNLLPFGGLLDQVQTSAEVFATFVPTFPVYPPEFSWMRQPRTSIPAIILRGRCAYLPADIDRCYGRGNLPDHGDLLAGILRWAVGDEPCLEVVGPGTLDCHLYRQRERHILHIINLSGCSPWPGYVEEHLPVGPLEIRLRTAGQTRTLQLPRVVDHEMLVI